jgi:PhoPQ-activated pathogenicity-related protein
MNDDGRESALTTLAVFAQLIAEGKSLPNIVWQHDDDEGRMRLTVHSKPAPQSVRLWVARSDDKDFRPDRWEASDASANGDGAYVVHVEKPASGHIAFFAEATYEFGPVKYNLSTQIRQE